MTLPFQKPNQPERFVKLRHALLESPKWRNLPGIVQALYVDMARKYNGKNNGQISYSARDGAKAVHVSRDTANRALRLLEWFDLIRCTKRGSFKVKTKNAKAPEWLLTEYMQTEESLVRLEGPAGPTRRTSNDFPGPTRGPLIDKEIDLRREEKDFRGSEVFRGRLRPKEKTERLSREEWAALERLSKMSGDGR